jgi:PAS domain S-box-containing protein
MHSDISETDESTSKRDAWPPVKLLCGIWGCLGLAFVWLAWSTYITSHGANSVYARQIRTEALDGVIMQWNEVLTMSAVLTAWLGIWHALACRRQHRRLLSSVRRGEHEPTAIAVSENEAHYWALFENTSDFVYTLDMQGHFTAVTKTGERLLGYARDELVGMKLADIMPPESLTYSQQMHITKEAGTAWATYEVEMITKDHQRVPLEVSTRLIHRGGKPVGLQGIARDITKRKQAEEALKQTHDALEIRVTQRTAELQRINEQLHLEIAERQRAEAHYWELFENASDLVYTVDMQGRLTSINKAGERILGYSRAEVVGRELAKIVSPESLIRSRQMRDTKEAGAAWTTYEVELITKDNRHVPLEVSSRFIYRDEKPIGIQGIGRDVTERKQAEAALKQARDELEMRVAQRTAELQRINEQLHLEIAERQQVEAALRIAKDAAEVANRAKSEFLATITHELRTPMNGICGMTGLLLDTVLDDEQREYAETVQKCSDDLLTLINDMLNFSQIETGKCALNIVEFELRIVVEDALATLAEAAHKKGLTMTASIHSDVPHCVVGDPGRLLQVLTILIGNAVKFTETGEVVVSVRRVEDTATEVVVSFAVTDTGIGIPAEAHGKLFQVFSQVDGSSTRKYGGTGLGLAIAKRLVTMMDGEIGVESTPGQGSTFWFTVRFSACATAGDTVPVRPVYGRPRRQPRERPGR